MQLKWIQEKKKKGEKKNAMEKNGRTNTTQSARFTIN